MKAQSQVEKTWILGTKSVQGKKGSWEIPNTLIGDQQIAICPDANG